MEVITVATVMPTPSMRSMPMCSPCVASSAALDTAKVAVHKERCQAGSSIEQEAKCNQSVQYVWWNDLAGLIQPVNQ